VWGKIFGKMSGFRTFCHFIFVKIFEELTVERGWDGQSTEHGWAR
jgi:hypothetical protein